MKPQPCYRLRAALDAADLSHEGLARHAYVSDRSVRRWLAGTYPVPDDVLEWIEARAAFALLYPCPQKKTARHSRRVSRAEVGIGEENV